MRVKAASCSYHCLLLLLLLSSILLVSSFPPLFLSGGHIDYVPDANSVCVRVRYSARSPIAACLTLMEESSLCSALLCWNQPHAYCALSLLTCGNIRKTNLD